jgi:hypothetical protein
MYKYIGLSNKWNLLKKTDRQTNYYASLTQKKYADLIQTVCTEHNIQAEHNLDKLN